MHNPCPQTIYIGRQLVSLLLLLLHFWRLGSFLVLCIFQGLLLVIVNATEGDFVSTSLHTLTVTYLYMPAAFRHRSEKA